MPSDAARANLLYGRFWPDGCLWGLAPQSGPSPIWAAYPSSAFGEHWEPRLPATLRHSVVRTQCPKAAIWSPCQVSGWAPPNREAGKRWRGTLGGRWISAGEEL